MLDGIQRNLNMAIQYEHQEKADKLAEKMNEGISPYAWYINKVNDKLAFNGIS